MPIPRTSFFVILILFIFVVSGCSMTTVTGTWKSSEYTGKPFTSILVVGLTSDPTNRLKWENSMADRLSQHGVQTVVKSLSAFPDDRNIDEKEIIEYVNKQGIEGVLVTRLVDTKSETIYKSAPPTGAFYSGSGDYGYYRTFSSYYNFAYRQVSAYSYATTQTIVLLETNLYKVTTQDLVWSMASDTIESNSVKKLIESASKKVLSGLDKDQLI